MSSSPPPVIPENTPPVTQAEIVAGLRRLGIVAGDLVFFHSSLKSFGRVEGGPDAVIDALLAAVGPTGTVVAPSFNLIKGDRQAAWNVATCPSTVGLITEVFRHRPGARRSDHYSHAVAAIGPLADEITRYHARVWDRPGQWPQALGTGSPFDHLYRRNAHYLLIGVDFTVCTLFHYVECWWHSDCLWPLAPGANFCLIDRVVMNGMMDQTGLIKQTQVGPCTIRHLRARTVADFVLSLLFPDPRPFIRPYAQAELNALAARHGWDAARIPWPQPMPVRRLPPDA
jgi:aminoglycoside 3-N-acetyltransferase